MKKLYVTNSGRAVASKEIFRPYLLDIQLKRKLPTKFPVHMWAPTHEICSIFSGPDARGGSVRDCSCGKLADGQPQIVPTPMVFILAAWYAVNNKLNKYYISTISRMSLIFRQRFFSNIYFFLLSYQIKSYGVYNIKIIWCIKMFYVCSRILFSP